jgi:NIMA (never in mitosis gene a)-related kinase 1/4/5
LKSFFRIIMQKNRIVGVASGVSKSEEASSSTPHGSLADFTVLKQLGKGSYGTVLQVRHNASNVIYALKKCDISKMARREIADCLGEVRFLASVHHTNIIKFIDAFVTRDAPTYLCTVMEFADGGDLSAKVERHKARNSPLSEDVIFAYFLQMVEAIAHLHRLKVLHRDLKTANVFLTANGQIKVGDLGVSSGSLSKGKLANTQIGTPFYMSPEIWANKPYDDKSDIWALGCILYELAALKPPFNGRDISDLSRKVQAGTFAPAPSTYSKDLHSVIAACLQVNPKHRPSAEELLAFPAMTKNRERLKDKMAQTLYNALLEYGDDVGEDDQLLGTIAVPSFGNMRKLTDALPAPQYESIHRSNSGGGGGGGGGGGASEKSSGVEVGGGGGALSSALNNNKGGGSTSPKSNGIVFQQIPQVRGGIASSSDNDKDMDFLSLGVRDSKPLAPAPGVGVVGGVNLAGKPPVALPAAPLAGQIKRSDSNNGIAANNGPVKPLVAFQPPSQKPPQQEPLPLQAAAAAAIPPQYIGPQQRQLQQQKQQQYPFSQQQDKEPLSRVQQKILQQLQNDQQLKQQQQQQQQQQQVRQPQVYPGAAAGVVPGLASYGVPQQQQQPPGQVRLVQYQQRQQQYQQQMQQQVAAPINNLRPLPPSIVPPAAAAAGPYSRQNAQYVMDPRPFAVVAPPVSALQQQPPMQQQQQQPVGVSEARRIADDEAKAKLRAIQDKQDKYRLLQQQQQQQLLQQQQLQQGQGGQRQQQYRYGGGAAAMPQAIAAGAGKVAASAAAPPPNWWG